MLPKRHSHKHTSTYNIVHTIDCMNIIYSLCNVYTPNSETYECSTTNDLECPACEQRVYVVISCARRLSLAALSVISAVACAKSVYTKRGHFTKQQRALRQRTMTTSYSTKYNLLENLPSYTYDKRNKSERNWRARSPAQTAQSQYAILFGVH